MVEDLLALMIDKSRISWQMAKNLSVFFADCLDFLAKLAKNLSVFLVDGPLRFCQQMAKAFLAFWADCPAGLFGKAIQIS